MSYVDKTVRETDVNVCYFCCRVVAVLWNAFLTCSRVPVQKLTVTQPIKKFPAFYESRIFNIIFPPYDSNLLIDTLVL